MLIIRATGSLNITPVGSVGRRHQLVNKIRDMVFMRKLRQAD